MIRRPIDTIRALENVKELTMILPVIFIPLKLENEVA